MKRLSLVSVLAAVLLIAPVARANHSWGTFHWARSANPFGLQVVDSVTGPWDALLPAVTGDWGASSVLNLSLQGGSTGLLGRILCNPIAGKIRVCNANYGPSGWFGVAQVWLSGSGHISQATTKVNDFYFTGTYGNDIARRHVLCQEIGHDIGLDHHKQPSCMDDTNSTLNNPSYLRPNGHDYAELESIYAHLDGGAKVAQGPASRGPAFVERVGDGTLLTFVLWVTPGR